MNLNFNQDDKEYIKNRSRSVLWNYNDFDIM